MRAREIFYESFELISEKTSADELIPYLEPLGFDVKKMTANKVKVVVPAALRYTGVDQISQALPGSSITPDGKALNYDGATILVKPAEAQGGRLEKETAQRNAINDAIVSAKGNKAEIPLIVGNRVVNAAGAVPAHKGVKADIAIIDAKNRQVAWVSLKDGNAPRGFQGWGGVTHAPVVDHPEVQNFVKRMKKMFPNGLPEGIAYGTRINDATLKNQVVFGKEFGNEPGQSNVDLVLQGHPRIEQTAKGMLLTGDHHWVNGQTPDGAYEPVLIASWRGDRSNFGIQNARLFVYPSNGRPWKDISSKA